MAKHMNKCGVESKFVGFESEQGKQVIRKVKVMSENTIDTHQKDTEKTELTLKVLVATIDALGHFETG